MDKKYLSKKAMIIFIAGSVGLFFLPQLNAQVQGIEPQVIKWLSTSALRNWFSNMGCEPEYCRRDRATYVAVDQIDGLCWPNEFNIRMKGVKAAKATWIGATNFTDPVSNTTYPYKVVCIGKDAIYSGSEIFADELSLLGRFPHPSVYVDGVSASARDFDDAIDKEDNTLPADRVMMNRFHTSIGISVTRKILSFSQQYNNNYYIYEYTFKNSGIIDESGLKKLNVPLTGVIFYFQTRASLCGVSYTGSGTTGAGSWAPAGTTWGRNTINDVIRKDGPTPGEFRASLSYWGPMSTSPYGSPAADIGLPGPVQTAVTELAGYEFAGTVVLHADLAANEPTDDITQPTTTMYAGADLTTDRNTVPTQYNLNLMALKYTTYMNAGHAGYTQAEQIGEDANGWPTGYANIFGSDAGGYMATQGFGPYNINPGDSIRIVVAEAVAGISWNKACEVAKNWFAVRTGSSNPTLQLPIGYKNGGTTTDPDEYKNAWVFSGKDSLFQTFRRAIAAYNNNYIIPQPPPPPDDFEVNSGANRIEISWSKNAESSPHFNGYRLYRSEGKTDTTYDLIFECNKSNSVNSYNDKNVTVGSNYYYYIQTKDDGSTNPGNPALNIPAGEPLVSSRYYTMTNTPASLLLITTGTFRSHQSGDWNDLNSWERFDGQTWVNPAPNIPNDTNDVITIMKGHTITVTTADSADQLIIASGGTLTIGGTATFRIKNGTGMDLLVNGTIENSGSMILGDSANVEFSVKSNYIHKQNGGTILKAGWETGSTCEITGVTNTVPSNNDQNFYNFIWNCPSQSANLNLNWQNGINISGALTVTNTNWNRISTSSPSFQLGLFSANGYCILGSCTINGSQAVLTSQTGGFNNSIIINGDITISSGGMLSLSNNNGVATYYLKGSFTVQDSGYIANIDPPNSSTIIFSGSGSLSAPPTCVQYIGAPNFHVSSGASLSMGSNVFTGAGSFAVDSNALLETTHPEGFDGNIKVTGAKIFSKNVNYMFNGTEAQVTGSLMPDTVGSLIISDSAGVTLSHGVVINGTLERKSGVVSTGGNLLSYGTNGTLKYSGTSAQRTSDVEFPLLQGPKNLIISNTRSVTLHTSRSIRGTLDLQNNGGELPCKLILGPYSLTADSASNTPNSYSVYNYIASDSGGVFRLSNVGSSQKLFPVGTSTGYAPIWIANSGIPDTISVYVKDDAGKPVDGGRVKAKWQINEKTPADGNYTICFGWVSSLEDSTFQKRRSNGRIYRLSPDTAQIASSGYTRPIMTGGYSLQHANITTLGMFTVGTFTGLSDVGESQKDTPSKFFLSQNYPNPFNPSTTIRFQLQTQSYTSLRIYDVLGREAATLVSSVLPAGNHSVEWNASHLASGIYFYKLHAGNYTTVRKLVLMK